MRLDESARSAPRSGDSPRPVGNNRSQSAQHKQPQYKPPQPQTGLGSGLMAEALAQALKGRK